MNPDEIDGTALRAELSALVAAVGEQSARRMLRLEADMELDRLLADVGIGRDLPTTRKRRLAKVKLMEATGTRWWSDAISVTNTLRDSIVDWSGPAASAWVDYMTVIGFIIGPPSPEEPPTPDVVVPIEPSPEQPEDLEEKRSEGSQEFNPRTVQPDRDGVFRGLTLDQIEQLHEIGRLQRNPSSEDSRFWPPGE